MEEEMILPNPVFELAETFFSIASTLSQEQTRYWARRKQQLEELLNKKEISLISDQLSETGMDAQPEVSLKKVLYRPEYIDRSPNGNADLSLKCPATQEGAAYEYKFECNLFPDELLEYLGGKETLKANVFGLQQIRALALKQTMKKKQGVLHLHCLNYFPVLNKHGNICFAYIHWARYKSHSKLKGAHSWEFGITRKEKYIHEGARLFVFQNKTGPRGIT